MNQSFYELPTEKQNKLRNAGYKVFSLNTYKKAAMLEIADEAGISKSLLFYYFRNKQELYLFLFDEAVVFMNKEVAEGILDRKHELFALVELSIERKMELLKKYPYIFRFIAKVYYEMTPDLQPALQVKRKAMLSMGMQEVLPLIETDRFVDAADMPVVFQMLLLIGEGCMRGHENLDYDKITQLLPGFRAIMASLKKRYYKEES
jgi:TetR/AcrR family transcriptional regulator